MVGTSVEIELSNSHRNKEILTLTKPRLDDRFQATSLIPNALVYSTFSLSL